MEAIYGDGNNHSAPERQPTAHGYGASLQVVAALTAACDSYRLGDGWQSAAGSGAGVVVPQQRSASSLTARMKWKVTSQRRQRSPVNRIQRCL
ncbi:hypothetical protein Baya_5779 [Bagarius yarrelli]|uniref:Uncharacterized protein n=1 Tax=Bagarius yarrelli TaxID=175774 RepID=A0A556TYG4_BAGYA|nr:hypothetical protein Baya_5779 [Bagarius yarrelli]